MADVQPPKEAIRHGLGILAWALLIGGIGTGLVLYVGATKQHRGEGLFGTAYSTVIDKDRQTLGIGVMIGSLLGGAVLMWMAATLDSRPAQNRDRKTPGSDTVDHEPSEDFLGD